LTREFEPWDQAHVVIDTAVRALKKASPPSKQRYPSIGKIKTLLQSLERPDDARRRVNKSGDGCIGRSKWCQERSSA